MSLPHFRTRGNAFAVLSWTVLISLVALIIRAATSQPEALTSHAPDQFSSDRAIALLTQIAQRPHPVGSPEHERVQEALIRNLKALGLITTTEPQTGIRVVGHVVTAARVVNIIGRLPGTANTKPIVLAAHYDSVAGAPGAGDDASHVAMLLETVRALKAGPALKNDLILVLTDGEELGLLGSRAIASHDQWLRRAGLVLNFEGRGDQGPALLFESSSGNLPLIQRFVNVAPQKTGSSLYSAVYRYMPNATDFSTFRDAGLAGLNFSSVRRLETYHSRLDTVENLDVEEIKQSGGYALTLARAFGNLDLNKEPLTDSRNAIFFNLFGTTMMQYSDQLVKPLATLLTVALGILSAVSMRRNRLSMARVLQAACVALMLLIVVPTTMLAICCLFQLIFPAQLLVGDVPATAWLFASTLLLSFGTGRLCFFRLHEGWGLPTIVIGGSLITCVLMMLMAWIIADASFILFWPLVFTTISLLYLLLDRPGRNIEAVIVAWLCAVPALLLLAPAIYYLYIGLQVGASLALSGGTLLGVGLLNTLPLVEVLTPTRRHLQVVFLASVVCAIVGVLLLKPSLQHPAPDSMIYKLNADSGRAQWASFDTAPDPWTSKILTSKPFRGEFAFHDRDDSDALIAPAPVVELAAPEADVVSVSETAGVRTTQIMLTSRRRTQWLEMQVDGQVLAASINGEMVPLENVKSTSKKTPVWRFSLSGFSDTSVSVTMKLAAASCSATLTDGSYGLPPIVEARPLDRIARAESDYTMVTTRVRIC